MLGVSKKSLVAHLEQSRDVARSVAMKHKDQMMRRAARAIVKDINDALESGFTSSDFKRITRAFYRLFACVNGGIAA